MNNIFSVVPLGHHGVVEEGEELQFGETGERLEVRELLERVVGEDESVEVGQTELQPLSDPDDPVVVQQEALHSVHVREPVQLPHFIIAEVYRVILVQCSSEILYDRNLVSPEVQFSVSDGVDVLARPLYDVRRELHHCRFLENKLRTRTFVLSLLMRLGSAVGNWFGVLLSYHH